MAFVVAGGHLRMCTSESSKACKAPRGRPSVSRRAALQIAVAACAVAGTSITPQTAGAATSVSGRQVVNGILSGYGLPTLQGVDGFSALLEQFANLVIEFEYPADWIVARNVLASQENSADIALSTAKLSFGSSTTPMEGRSSGLTAGDYRKAEGVAFFVSPDIPQGAKNVADLPARVIMDLVYVDMQWIECRAPVPFSFATSGSSNCFEDVQISRSMRSLETPGDATGTASMYTITKDTTSSETGYRTIFSKYESTTVSGYTVERRGITTAVVLGDGKLYALCGTCTANRYKYIGEKLQKSVDSFRVYRL